MSKDKKVHHAQSPGKVLCNFNRWKNGSMDLTSTRGWRLVTCQRCLNLKPKEK